MKTLEVNRATVVHQERFIGRERRWLQMGKSKQPYCFEVDEGELFAFAGIWDRWKERAPECWRASTVLANPAKMVQQGAPRLIHSDEELAEYTTALFDLTAKVDPTPDEEEAT
jgi:hypothetical protein